MATQVEILKSERVASRAVKILGVERSPAAVAQWREATEAKIPLERYFAGVLQRGLCGRADRAAATSSTSSFTAADPIFAQAAANAFAQAYMDVSVELRVAPARQSATFLDDQTKALRANLEKAQATLSKFQQTKGIVVTDERLDQENARYNSADRPARRWRRPSGSRPPPGSATPAARRRPTCCRAASVQSLKSQLASRADQAHRSQQPSSARTIRRGSSSRRRSPS